MGDHVDYQVFLHWSLLANFHGSNKCRVRTECSARVSRGCFSEWVLRVWPRFLTLNWKKLYDWIKSLGQYPKFFNLNKVLLQKAFVFFLFFFPDIINARCNNFVSWSGTFDGSHEYQIVTDDAKSWFDALRSCKVRIVSKISDIELDNFFLFYFFLLLL